jgi:cytochrome c
MFKDIDLKGINQLDYKYSSKDQAATIDVHLDSPTGPVISTLAYESTGKWDNYQTKRAPVTATTGKHDVYFVIHKDDPAADHLITLETITFGQ